MRHLQWQAAAQQHNGLLLRQLRQAGARVPQDLIVSEPDCEVCAVCKMHFADFRAWSVHAFKTHARVDEVRRLAEGSQCPTCLRHYPTPIQLARHLKHSRPCRQPLLSRGFWSVPEPGQGNRKALDKGLICAPALQAEGPARPEIDIFVEDEVRRPSAEVLDCLALVGYDMSPSSLPEAVLCERIRLAFSCVCLPLSRLRATAEAWQGGLLACACSVLPDADRQVLCQAAEWVCNTEFAQWLVPAPRGPTAQSNTFAHSTAALEVLSLREVVLPDAESWTSDHVLLCIGDTPADWTASVCPARRLCYPHRDSLMRIANGQPIDFLDETPEECGACITLFGLPSNVRDCRSQSPRDFSNNLRGFQLACDLVRLTLRMWQRGAFAALELGNDARSLSRHLSNLPGIHTREFLDRMWMWNGQGSGPAAQFHPSN